MNPTCLDCKGLPCPQPVLQCKQCIDAQGPNILAVSIDNEAALLNVSRFLDNQGYQIASAQISQNEWRITARRGDDPRTDTSQDVEGISISSDPKTLVFLSTTAIGTGDAALGEKLMSNFLATLPEMGPQLWRMILVNGAVQMTVEGNPNLEALRKLEASGVDILVCGTCLTHFGLLDKKAIGQTTNMLDVVTSLQLAEKVLHP